MQVVLGLSGGVDSSVAAFMLQKKYQVVSIFMKIDNHKIIGNKLNSVTNICNSDQDYKDAILISNKLKIPFTVIDITKIYKKYIISYIYKEYSLGRTPNPDIICNKLIKFNILIKISISLGINKIATGHYAIVKKCYNKNNKKVYKLFSGVDPSKDQSYFLSQLNQHQLSKSIFPLGFYKKKHIRKIAHKIGLITYNKKDSQGLCFVGKISLTSFLHKKFATYKGKIIKIPNNSYLYATTNIHNKKKKLIFLSKAIEYKENDGYVIGSHNGAFAYTKGQRKGLKIGGLTTPLFVLDTDTINNIIYVGQGRNHPGLYRKVVFTKKHKINCIGCELIIDNDLMIIKKISCRIRYRQNLQKAIMYIYKEGIYTEFLKKQFSITEGQFITWYYRKQLIASAVI